MFAKLLTIILVAGGTAAALLVNRQQRIDTAHEMSVLHERLIDHRRALWRLRSEIAGRCRPDFIRTAIVELGETWTPIPAEPMSVSLEPVQYAADGAVTPDDDLGG